MIIFQDDERLRNERVRALKAKERFAQSVSGIGSDSVSFYFLQFKFSYKPLSHSSGPTHWSFTLFFQQPSFSTPFVQVLYFLELWCKQN